MPGSRRAGGHAHRADRRARAAQRGPDIELGLGVQSDKSPDEYVAIARRADAAGFDVISVYHDLLFQPAIAPLLLMAGATSRIRLGPAALNPYTLHPVEIAGQVAALDLASRGRAYLGLVHGTWLDQLGLEQRKPLTVMREAVEVVRRLLAGDRSGFHGERFTLAAGAGFHYAPYRREVPLMIGTWRPRLAALAGKVADEVKIGGCANPDMVPVMRAWIGNDRVGIVLGAVCVVDEDGDAARARAREEVGMYLDVVGDLDPTLGAGEPPLEKFAFTGTPEEVAAQVRELWAAGAKRVELGTPQTSVAGVDYLARRLRPLLY